MYICGLWFVSETKWFYTLIGKIQQFIQKYVRSSIMIKKCSYIIIISNADIFNLTCYWFLVKCVNMQNTYMHSKDYNCKKCKLLFIYLYLFICIYLFLREVSEVHQGCVNLINVK